jgi:tRNA/tmRNA/rRNA uracil-C5-methylase (TrmA/RlmC/RlmD family)
VLIFPATGSAESHVAGHAPVAVAAVAVGDPADAPARDFATPRPPRKFVDGPFKYHEEIELTIDGLTNLGCGVGRLDSWVVFVPFALPGERVRARIFRNHRRHSEADLVAVLVPSPSRVPARCPVFGTCSGCQYQTLAYDAQLEWKQKQVTDLLGRLAGLPGTPVAPTLPSPRQYHYRAKLTPHTYRPKPDAPRHIGFLQSGTRTRIIDVESCPIATEELNGKLSAVRGEVLTDATRFAKGGTLLLRHSGPHEVTSDPNEVCETEVGGLRFQYRARDFFQTNPFVLDAFVAYVRGQAVGSGATHLVDAYCGCGLFALCCADAFEVVAGVEVTPSSVEWAVRNADLNAISNASFLLGDSATIFATVATFPAADTVVVIDPPRKGCSPDFLRQLIDFGPRGVVYVSCDPATQMRDVVALRLGGYEVAAVQPVDLFPQTRHLESVVTLRRRSPIPADPAP